jgi:hypothetical protein
MIKIGISALVTAFEMKFARASVDSFAQPSDVLHRRIAIIEEAMPEMMDYIRREGPRKVYDGINRIYEKSAKEDTSSMLS